MRIVLPPSETKRSGGLPGTTVKWDGLVLPELTPTRRANVADLLTLGKDPSRAAAALGLGTKNLDYLEDNRSVVSSATLPAIERYTGVLYDALHYSSLSDSAQATAAESVWIFSALFGPLRASDLIPRYRLSWDTKLPGDSLKNRWRSHAKQIWGTEFTIDLRSEGYRDLAPLIEGSGVFVKFVRDASGTLAVGHANKATKGHMVRALLTQSAELATAEDFVRWARGAGWSATQSISLPNEVLVAAGPPQA